MIDQRITVLKQTIHQLTELLDSTTAYMKSLLVDLDTLKGEAQEKQKIIDTAAAIKEDIEQKRKDLSLLEEQKRQFDQERAMLADERTIIETEKAAARERKLALDHREAELGNKLAQVNRILAS